MEVKNPDLLPLFHKLKAILVPYEKYFTPRHNEPGYYDLWSEKEVEINGRLRKEVFFTGLIIQKHYVGFYYMPVYTNVEMKKFFPPELLATLKGKSCFYIKKDDPLLLRQIEQVLDAGLQLYQKRGWV